MRIHHQQLQFFLTVFLVQSGKQHAAGFQSHHRAGRKIDNGDQCFPDQGFRLIVPMDTAQDRPFVFRSVVQCELQQLFALRNSHAVLDLDSPEIGLGESLKIDEILEERLDLHVGKVDLFRFGSCSGFFGFAGPS